jgi:hypothetical protein
VGGDALCDHFSLSVPVASSYWSSHTGAMHVSIGWGSSSDNFYLYVYRGGNLVASSTSGSSSAESVSITSPSGSYSVVVVPKLVTNSGYGGHATFSAQAKPSPSPSGSGGGGSGGSGGGSSGGGGTTTSGGSSSGGSSSGGSSSSGAQVLQPGAQHDFGPLAGPLFNYRGPYHFKPPFSISDSPGHAVLPPQDAPGAGSVGSVVGGGGGGGQAVQPPQSGDSSGTTRSGSSGSSGRTVTIRTAGGGNHGGMPKLIWLLVPLGLIALAAVGKVVLDGDGETTAKVAGRPAADQRGDRPPAVGPFVALGFAVRRLVRGRRRNGQA